MLYITSFQFADQVFSRGVALFERVQFTKDACNAASCHVTRSRTRFSREFRARGGDQGTLGSAIAESITRIAINTVLSLSLFLSAIGVDERARITRAFNAHTTGQIEIKPAIFLHSMDILMSNHARRKCQVPYVVSRAMRCL